MKNQRVSATVVVAEDRREQLVHPVAERCRPQRALHRARPHLVVAVGAVHLVKDARVDAERLGEPLAVALLERVGGPT